MGIVTEPGMVKLFVGMLSRDVSLLEELKINFSDIFGRVDLESPVWPWEHTDYYKNEMGQGLLRKFIFFENLINPGDISGTKLLTNEMEKRYCSPTGARDINLDPGYMDAAKVVLVSTKDFSHRLYLDRGIYGEVTLLYSGKTYQTLPYTFPDFRTSPYLDLFSKARDMYKLQIRSGRK